MYIEIISYVDDLEIKDLNRRFKKNIKASITKEEYESSKDIKKLANSGLILVTPIRENKIMANNSNKLLVPNLNALDRNAIPRQGSQANPDQTHEIKSHINNALYEFKNTTLEEVFEKTKKVVELESEKNRSLITTSINSLSKELISRTEKIENNFLLILGEIRNISTAINALKENGISIVTSQEQSSEVNFEASSQSPSIEDDDLFASSEVFIPNVKISDDIKSNFEIESESSVNSSISKATKKLKKTKEA